MRKIRTNSLLALCLASGLIGGCMVRPVSQTPQQTGVTGAVQASITLPAQRTTQIFNPAAINSLKIELLGTHDNTPLDSYVANPYRPGTRLVAYANRVSAAASAIHVSFPSVPIGDYLIRVTSSPFYIQNLSTAQMNSEGVIDTTLVTVTDALSPTNYVGVLPQSNPSLHAGTPMRPETDMNRADGSGRGQITLNSDLDSLAIDLNGSGTFSDPSDYVDLNGDGKTDGLDLNGDGDASDSVTFAIDATDSLAVLPEADVEKKAEVFARYLFTSDNEGLKLTAPTFLDPTTLFEKAAGYGVGYGAVVVSAGQNAGVAVRVLSTTSMPGIANSATLGKKTYTTLAGSGKYTVSVTPVPETPEARINGDLVLGSDSYAFPSWASWSVGVQYNSNTTALSPTVIGTFSADVSGDCSFSSPASRSIGTNTKMDIVLCNETDAPIVALGSITTIAVNDNQSFSRLTKAEGASLIAFQASFDGNGYGNLREIGGLVTDLPPILDTGNYVYKVFREHWGTDGQFGDNTKAGIAKLEDNEYTELGTLRWINSHVSLILPTALNDSFTRTNCLAASSRLIIALAKKYEEKPLAVFYKQNGSVAFN